MDNKRKETEDYYEEQSKKYKNPRTHDPLLPHELHLPFRKYFQTLIENNLCVCVTVFPFGFEIFCANLITATFGMPPPERTDVDRQSYGYYNNGPPPPRYHPYPEMPPQYYKPPPVQQNYQDHCIFASKNRFFIFYQIMSRAFAIYVEESLSILIEF